MKPRRQRRLIPSARRLRREMTDAEAKLWWKLRRGQLGFRFRRQEPLGPFIVDFVCQERRLVIEVDGGQHLDSSYDRARDAWLAQRGYRVLRLWNGDVLSNLEGITEQVYLELYGPSP